MPRTTQLVPHLDQLPVQSFSLSHTWCVSDDPPASLAPLSNPFHFSCQQGSIHYLHSYHSVDFLSLIVIL